MLSLSSAASKVSDRKGHKFKDTTRFSHQNSGHDTTLHIYRDSLQVNGNGHTQALQGYGSIWIHGKSDTYTLFVCRMHFLRYSSYGNLQIH
uniref:Uncharacterized protein n=1 Tax=Setaria italica TaxID=4555 RepID=K3Y0D5_SETIT